MDSEKLDRRMTSSTRVLSSLVIFVAAIYTLMATFGFDKNDFGNPAGWGQVGDYFGGLLNPVVGGFTLYWLLVSVRMQKAELSKTYKALEESHCAQLEQARLSLISTQLDSLNTKLSVNQAELSHARSLLAELRVTLAHKRFAEDHRKPNAKPIDLRAAFVRISLHRDALKTERDTLISQIDDLLIDASSASEKS